jgi:hypothetical protein
MGVCAAHVTLVDFGPDRGPSRAPPQQIADIRRFQFGVLMIELQDNRIGFTAINAWMRAQELKDSGADTLPLEGVLYFTSEDILRAMSSVITSEILLATGTAKWV